MNKYIKLVLSILLDIIGMVSFSLPLVGEFSDVIWAPLSAFIMTSIYKGITGKIAGVVNLFEELMPGLDFIPTFTLTWFYNYVIINRKNKNSIL
jgi:hypothetical protein|tara:strand:+ start:2690 stop:2971 length:282 start_codon:yes stop_codon:yes gene_type:complete